MTVRLVLLAFALLLPTHAMAAKESIAVSVTEPQPATLGGELYTPQGNGPHPAVILLHGCGGVTPNVPEWYNPKAHEDAEKQAQRFLDAHLEP